MGSSEMNDQIPRVLVVEDHEGLLESRLNQLAHHGVEAVGSRTAEHAAAYLVGSGQPVSLAIVDVNLRPNDADRSGLALARLVRSSGMDIPVVGYSAHFADRKGGEGLSQTERSEFTGWIEKGRDGAAQIADRYAELALDAAAASHVATLGLTPVGLGAVAGFVASTSDGAVPETAEARSYLKAVVAGYDPLDHQDPYDPLHDPGAESSPSLAADPPPLPESISSGLITVGPEALS